MDGDFSMYRDCVYKQSSEDEHNYIFAHFREYSPCNLKYINKTTPCSCLHLMAAH